jgi:chlorobactene glucosyltransferase
VRVPDSVDLLPALPWVLPFLTLPRLTSRKPNLSESPVESGIFVSIIVPARNESATITRLLRSILGTTYGPFEVVVVDDRSTDDTASVVESLADERVRVIRGEELPDGWYGKPWACYQGYRAAKGNLLLFTDADTQHSPALLGHAVGALIQQDAGLVTISPLQRCITFWERVIMPQIWFLLALRYHPPAVNRARRERDVIANGQFILVSREAYVKAGTHAAVKHEVAEDLALAQTFLRQGLKLHFAFAERLMETRMYQNLPQLIEGWSKNIYLGGRRSFPHEPLLRSAVPAMLIIAMVFWLLPPLALLTGFGHWTPAATLATVMSGVFWTVMCRQMQIPSMYGWAYPLGAIMSLYIILRSSWRGGRRVEWRGRVYSNPK